MAHWYATVDVAILALLLSIPYKPKSHNGKKRINGIEEVSVGEVRHVGGHKYSSLCPLELVLLFFYLQLCSECTRVSAWQVVSQRLSYSYYRL